MYVEKFNKMDLVAYLIKVHFFFWLLEQKEF